MPTTLITGANRGIGLALTREFLANGHDVIATARDPGSADALNATGATVMALDVADPASIAALKAELGDKPQLIRIETRAGHGSGKPTDKAIEEASDILAFLAAFTGLDLAE